MRDIMKKCSKCKQELDESHFSKNRSICKQCSHNYYILNKSKISMMGKETYQKNRDKRLEYQRNYRKNNPEKKRNCDRNYHLNHRIYTCKYINGLLNPDGTTGMGIITEHIVYSVLKDCTKYNIKGYYNSEYDLKSNQYGNINVKSSSLRILSEYNKRWLFRRKDVSKIPDYYICLGFDENKIEIQRVWIIPGNVICTQQSLSINNSEKGLSRVRQYEVNTAPYNECYQNLDIYSMPEFCNFNSNVE